MRREWAEIAGELHRRGLFWIVADIVAELVPTGRAAVDGHKALYEYLGPDYVCLPSESHCLTPALTACFLVSTSPAKALSGSTSRHCNLEAPLYVCIAKTRHAVLQLY